MKLRVLSPALVLFAIGSIHASTIYTYTNWTSATNSSGPTSGSVSGTLTFGSNVVDVAYTGDVAGAQTNGSGTNYYNPASDYFNSVVSNAPTSPDIIQLSQAFAYTDTLTFSQPLVNPVIDIVSLGAPGNTVGYNFNATPTILSQGTDDWGGCNTCLSVSGDTVNGNEGSGAVEFVGTFSSISWTATGGEYWNGITFAAPGVGSSPSAVPEPSSLLLLGSGIAGMIGMVRRRRAVNS
jgi:hypothetical protein